MEHSQTYTLRVREDEFMKETGSRSMCVVKGYGSIRIVQWRETFSQHICTLFYAWGLKKTRMNKHTVKPQQHILQPKRTMQKWTMQKKETSLLTRWNTVKLTYCVCETTSWWKKRQAGGFVYPGSYGSIRIVQWRKTFCQHSLKRTVWGINKTRMNKPQNQQPINTFY